MEGLSLPGCSLCRLAARSDERWMDTFFREGFRARELRLRFYAAGGFCHRHAWLLHDRAAQAAQGAVIADVYGKLGDRHLQRLAEAAPALGRRRRRRRLLARADRCPACVEAEGALERGAYFLAQALREEALRRRYAGGDGLCFVHLEDAVAEARRVAPEVACFLLDDWRRRLAQVRDRLAEYDRKRDYRRAVEPPGDEQGSWTDVIRLYVGPKSRR